MTSRSGSGFNGVVIDLGHHFETYPNYQNLLKISTKSASLSQILCHCRRFTTPLNQNPDEGEETCFSVVDTSTDKLMGAAQQESASSKAKERTIKWDF